MYQNYRYIWSEKRSLINIESHLLQYVNERDVFGSTHTRSFIFAKDGLAEEQHMDIDNKKWIKAGHKLLKKDFFNKILRNGKVLRKQFEKFLSKIRNVNLSAISDKELIGLFEQSVKFYSRFRAYFKITRPEFLSQAENVLKTLLKQHSADQNLLQKKFEILTTPSLLDEVNREFVDWVKLLSKPSRDITHLITKHIREYPWLVAQTFDEEYILNQMTQKCKNQKKCIVARQEEVKKLMLNKKELQIEQRLLKKKLKDTRISYLSWLFREASLERMRLKGGWAGADYLYLPIYKEISKRTRIPLFNIYSFYRISEVISAIRLRKKTVMEQELNKRKKFFVLLLKNKKILFFSGQQAKLIINKKLEQTTIKQKGVGNLKGRVASQGYAKGSARIVIPGSISELDEALRVFKKGEILITQMTQPNMVPIMKRAAAVVTDEGGLVSHAAILAREFKIPCIVGTEIATKIIKNGNIIEVDANTGIIKILNKKTSI